MSEWLMRAALDTNVLVYAEGVGDPPRCDKARSLVARMPLEQIVLPAQTLGELYRVLTGKAGFDADRARMALLLIQSEVLPHSACLSARVARRRREVCSLAYIERRQRCPHAPRGKPCGGAGRIRLRR